MALSGTLVLLFLVAAVVALVAKRFKVPYTVALVVAGLLLGTAPMLRPPALTKDLLFALFLPGLLFDAAFQLEADEFWRNRLTLFSLALPAVVAATVMIAAGLVGASHWTSHAVAWAPAVVFATLIAATDPIAVVAIVRTLGAPSRLIVLIEGESLLNDGTAAAAFAAAVVYVLGQRGGILPIVADFVYGIGAAVVVGGAIGMIASMLLASLDDAMIMITVTTTAAYGSFAAADWIGASGVIAAVTTGLLSGRESVQRAIAPSAFAALRGFWDYVAFALNSLVFLLMGVHAEVGGVVSLWREVLAAYLVVTVTRVLVTYGMNLILPRRERLPARWAALLAWSGLRGALALVLALSLPDAMPQRALIVTLTTGVVMLSILVQGLTVSPLLKALRIGPSTAT